MRSALTRLLLFLFLLAALPGMFACRKDEPEGPGAPAKTCDDTRRPIIFVHGFLGSGDTYAAQTQRFTTNGYCVGRLFAFDWNTLGDRDAAVLRLDSFVNAVLTATRATRVDLAGHSAGGGLCYTYLSDAARAAKVAHYAHLGSARQDGPAGPGGSVPTLNVYSDADAVVAGDDIPGAANLRLTARDHYQTATDPQTFEALYRFFTEGEAPGRTSIAPDDDRVVSGRVLSFGENQPQAGVTIEVYPIDPRTGQRPPQGLPEDILITAADGSWGPFNARPDVPYVFIVRPLKSTDRTLYYYREPFVRTNSLVYLRTLPGPGSIAGLLLAGIPQDDRMTALAVFSSSQAVIHQRDELKVQDLTLSSAEYAPAAATNIAFFLYDDGDYQSSGAKHGAFQLLRTFVTGIDYFIDTETATPLTLTFNGRTLTVPRLGSKSDGVVVAVFD